MPYYYDPERIELISNQMKNDLIDAGISAIDVYFDFPSVRVVLDKDWASAMKPLNDFMKERYFTFIRASLRPFDENDEETVVVNFENLDQTP